MLPVTILGNEKVGLYSSMVNSYRMILLLTPLHGSEAILLNNTLYLGLPTTGHKGDGYGEIWASRKHFLQWSHGDPVVRLFLIL